MPEKTFREIINSNPGPGNVKDSFKLFLKGLAMGAADIVPGVSGGTIALITGIYGQLIDAIRSFNTDLIRDIFRLRFKDALSKFHFKFIFVLFTGIGISILLLSRLINHLLIHHQPYIYSLFFGLIASSIFVLYRDINKKNISVMINFIIGTVFSYFLVGAVPATTPETYTFIFFSGFIAIMAMILPGISGAFILLLLGKYEFITGTLKNPFNPGNFVIIIIFCIGCASGLAAFARFLKWLIENYRCTTLAVLTGFMAGSLRKIWPWKEVLEKEVIGSREFIISEINIIPEFSAEGLFVQILIMLTGVIAVLLLNSSAGDTGSRK